MNFDLNLMHARMRDLTARTGNMPANMRKEAIDAALAADWDAMMSKVPGYLAGSQLITNRDGAPTGWFNVLSLGNWLTLAQSIGQRTVPARLLGLLDPVFAFRCASTGTPAAVQGATDPQRTAFIDLVQACNQMKRSEILRFDPCASARLKVVLQEDGESDADCRGLVNNGRFLEPAFDDPRLIDQFLWYTDAVMPVWARPWIAAMRIEARPSPMMPTLPPSKTRAVEWRLYVRDGKIVAASQYYPHAAIAADEARGRYGLGAALAAGADLLTQLDRLAVVPHHPRYELRDDVDTAKIQCTLDYLITPEGVPLLLEAGPAHLRNPNWGAHPCNFGVNEPPAGIALGEGLRAAL